MGSIPSWLTRLFGIFAASYQHLWSNFLDTPEKVEMATYIWHQAFKDYPPDIIIQAAFDAIKIHAYPPNVAQMLEIVKALYRNRTLEMPAIENHMRPPPHPVVAEYMLKHGIDENHQATQQSCKKKAQKWLDEMRGTVLRKEAVR